jgi:hypothetical protein
LKSPTKSASSCSLIITRRNASEILLLPIGSGWCLPRIDVDPEQRLAEQLTAEAMRVWKLETYCLLISSNRESTANTEARCAVMEAVRQNDKSPAGSYWVARAVAARCCELQDAGAISRSLLELDGYQKGQTAGQFACSGWLRELFRWTQRQIAPCGLRLTGGFRQLNASPKFTLVRFETDARAVWFKATGEPNSHELPVTVALARLFPRYLPRILGVHREWNGWLAEEAAGTSLDEIAEFAAWERVAGELAQLQIASVGKTAELLEAHARDLRIPRLVERIDPFIARMREFMAAQQKSVPAPLAASELAALAEGLKESCTQLASLELPDTIGHTDLNPGNIFVSEDRSIFLDWAEASVTNPAVTLQFLREYLVRAGIEEPAASEKLATAYLRPWAQLYPATDLRRALALAPLIAVFAYAVASDSWRSIEPTSDPQLAAYYRSLVRRMYREAVEASPRSELCLD